MLTASESIYFFRVRNELKFPPNNERKERDAPARSVLRLLSFVDHSERASYL